MLLRRAQTRSSWRQAAGRWSCIPDRHGDGIRYLAVLKKDCTVRFVTNQFFRMSPVHVDAPKPVYICEILEETK